jgi:curli production assembly/transport component CsgG
LKAGSDVIATLPFPTSSRPGGARRLLAAGAGLALLVVLGGCSTLPFGEQGSLSEGIYAPVVTPQTTINTDLRHLPPPTRRVTVAVYDFPDLTGQFKDEESFQSLSKAVTQGGAPMLIKALQDAGERQWFTVLDRAALNDLLKERQIVTEMRKVYRGEQNINPAVLPPLDNASIVLEGGIIGYDTNTLTGGAGANFLGIGGDTKWRQDTITVNLRAVSAKTSEVLASVTVNKVIASVALDGNVFRYVQMDKLLQAEAGLTQNEPKQIAVQAAIEKAVMSLIMEGAQLHVWSFRDKAAGDALIAEYVAEKYGQAVPPGALNPVPPATRNAAVAVQTVPVRRRAPAPAPQATVRTYQAPAGGAPSTAGAPAPTSLPPPQGANGEPLN